MFMLGEALQSGRPSNLLFNSLGRLLKKGEHCVKESLLAVYWECSDFLYKTANSVHNRERMAYFLLENSEAAGGAFLFPTKALP
jgi:hypothetical protein